LAIVHALFESTSAAAISIDFEAAFIATSVFSFVAFNGTEKKPFSHDSSGN